MLLEPDLAQRQFEPCLGNLLGRRGGLGSQVSLQLTHRTGKVLQFPQARPAQSPSLADDRVSGKLGGQLLQGSVGLLEVTLLIQGGPHSVLRQRRHVTLGELGQHALEQHHGRIGLLLGPGNLTQFVKRPVQEFALGKLLLQLGQLDSRLDKLAVVLEGRAERVQQLIGSIPLGCSDTGGTEGRNRLGRPLGRLVTPAQQQPRLGLQHHISQAGDRSRKVSHRRVVLLGSIQAESDPHRRRRHVLVFGVPADQPAEEYLRLGPVRLLTQQVRLAANIEHLGPQFVLGQLRVAQERLGRRERLGRLFDLEMGQRRHVQRAGSQLVLGVLPREIQETGRRFGSLLWLGVQRFAPEIHQLGQPRALGKCRDRLVVDDHRISRFLQLHQCPAQPCRRLDHLGCLRIGHHRSQRLLCLHVVRDPEPTLAGCQQRLGNVGTLCEFAGQRFENRRRLGQLLLLPYRVALLQQGQVCLGEVLHRGCLGE